MLASRNLVPAVVFASCLLTRQAVAGETTLFHYPGVQNNTEFGRVVANAGDVDADGTPDVIVGGIGINHTPGRVRVYSGRTGALLYDYVGLDGHEDFGYAVAGVGDVNSDGHADFAIGARWRSYLAGGQGHVIVHSGLDGSVLYEVVGDQGGDNLGFAIAGLGDVDGDGVRDFAAGFPSSSLNGFASGGFRVYSGVNGATLYTCYGARPHENLGFSLAAVGDLDGDGIGDLVAGAPALSQSSFIGGYAGVYSGATGTLLIQLSGESMNDRFGISVAAPGDVDGDGYDDILVGGSENDTGGTDAGMVRIFSGATWGVLLTIHGSQAGAYFGTAVSGLGDMDGDGRADFMVGAYSWDVTFQGDQGAVFLYSGTGQLLDTFFGTYAHGWMGLCVARAGDLDGDGIEDMLIGVPRDDAGGNQLGSARCDSGRICYTQEVCTSTPNSTGEAGRISSLGQLSVSANNFALLASSVPRPTAGYFFYSQTPALVPFGPGFRCTSGTLYRLPPVTGPNGFLMRTVDFTNPKVPAARILPGSTWYFQCLYRDSGPLGAPFHYNLTTSLKVAFCL